MTTTLIVPGHQVKALEGKDPSLARYGLLVETKSSVQASAASRGVGAETTVRDAADDDVVELQFTGGVRQWMRVDTLTQQASQMDRGLVTGRTLRIPPTLSPSATRGVAELVLEGMKLLKIDLIDKLTEASVREITRQFERKFEANPGLYHLDALGQHDGLVRDILPAGDAPYLIFIHGTFFNHSASFGNLVGTAEWRSLREFYRSDHILTLEHYTLSESPAENALALARCLPTGARIHLVTHSRGGLVGELLGLRDLPADALLPFEQAGAVRSEDIDHLTSLARLLQERQIHIERFVRVACPARGTLLASDRLDRYLSLFLNLIGVIPALEASEVYPFAKAVILSLIKQRANPAVLPGLEAQMPASPYIHLLNRPDLTSDADLAVVAGDIQGQGILGRLAVFATDLFYREDHDLVVDTDSMDEGPARSKPAFYSFQQGPDINHLAYFSNDVSRRRIAGWLMHKDQEEVPGFKELNRKPLPELEISALRSFDAEVPIVFLVPGLMATHLKAGNDRVWLSRASLAAGGLQRLAFDDSGQASASITVDSFFAPPYQELTKALQGRFEVIAFPYDWRRSFKEEGRRLAIEVAAELRKHNRTITILAHSTGGLLAQAMIAHDRATWDALCSRGGRLVMLGTPTRGTYTVLQLLTGRGPLAQMLTLLDPSHSAETVARTLRTFPGLVELLPDDPVLQDWNAPWWQAEAFQRLRAEARNAHAWLSGAVDREHMAYVAGKADSTPSGVRVGEDGVLQFQGIGLGDGVVTQALGELDTVPTWVMNAAHGDLANRSEAFSALVELLLHGTTTALSAPSTSRAADTVVSLSDSRRLLFPNEMDLVAAAVGATTTARPGKETFPLRVVATHGGLEHARHPVAVGHYEGDVLVGAESFLDARLGGRLGWRLAMNLYPGKRDTAEVILTPECNPTGAIVIGLGQIGEITPEILARGVTEAALRSALAVAECPIVEGEGLRWRSAAFSSVLMGTTGGRALSVETAVVAIVQGAIMANRILYERGMWDKVRIDEVEFIEQYEDIATHAAHVVKDLRNHLRIALGEQEDLQTAERLQIVEGGLLQRPVSEYAKGWWRRLQITATEAGSGSGTSALQFVLLTDRARAEESLEPTQRALVDKLVEQTIANPFVETLPATLYELLMPNTLKDQAYEMANLQLVLDRSAAQYPWEMLAERDRNRVIQPMAVRMGMLRQLKVPQFRDRVQYPRGNNALVIGEPDLGGSLIPLPKAAEEALAVAALLEAKGFKVTSLVKEQATALTIVDALFAQEYRIIHIAAHGFYDPGHPERSGVIIGDGIVLTAAEISKLRIVPELVFLNCCHLGKMDAGAAPLPEKLQETRRAWSRLAASISEELIRIGVRAVVAAGWAVDDQAARLFATEFYSDMLSGSGQGYGHAVQHARERTYNDKRVGASSNNTWGAYQCYGDPGFTFGDRAARMSSRVLVPVAAHEVLRELEEITRRAASPNREAVKPDLDRVRKLVAVLPSEWRTGKMLYTLGAAFGELGEFEEAIGYYQAAIRAPGTDEEVPFRTIEQLANLQARYADELHRRAHAGAELGSAVQAADREETRSSGLLEEAIANLRGLLVIAETPQRLALTGSFYKRLAATLHGDARQDALKHAASFYGKAHKMQRDLSLKLDPYYTLNWLTFRILEASGITASERKEMLDLVGQSLRAAPEKALREPDFWARVTLPDAVLVRALVEEALERRKAEIIGLYGDAFRLGASPRELDTVTQHVSFLAEMYEWKGRLDIAAALREIHTALT